MNELEQAVSGLAEETLNIMEHISSDDADGLEIFAALLQIPDKDFEVIRPLIQEEMINFFHKPEIQLELANLLQEENITEEGWIEAIQTAINETSNTEELSEQKIDFLRCVFGGILDAVTDSPFNPFPTISIPIELCRENAKLPTYATDGSAAMDVYSPEEYILGPGECRIIPTGLKVAIPKGYALLIQPRSGLSARSKLRIPNTPGLIDSDYHEEIGVIVENTDPPLKSVGTVLIEGEEQDANLYGSSLTIGKGERFAQMRLIKVPRVRWQEVNSIGTFDDDHGEGFGSTGSD